MMVLRWIFFFNHLAYVFCYQSEKGVMLVEWQEKCQPMSLALNDCNWCRCNRQNKYSCTARVCSNVDPFGHFNDAIADINVGMEGKGSWRTDKRSCEPGVEYRRTDLICICSEDGTWPNPVCRDVFRVLHQVELTDEREPKQQKCSPNKLYLIGCNVCFCPSSGKLDPELCTKKTCTGQDDILEIKEDPNDDEENASEELAIYATCSPDKKYSLGCKNCVCLKNNRLHCSNCTNPQYQQPLKNSQCSNFAPGQIFTVECNLCVCDENGYAYCTVKKCLSHTRTFSNDPYYNRVTLDKLLSNKPPSLNLPCVPGHTYFHDCNKCTCEEDKFGMTDYSCTLKACYRPKPSRIGLGSSFEDNLKALSQDCVVNTEYEHNCLICNCGMDDKGEKYESCQVNPKCNNDTMEDLDDLHGYCEPLHLYKKDCNVCKCLTDGKTVRCTSNVCDSSHHDVKPITIDIVPVSQPGDPCPRGSSYRIDCNFCFCLNNGNAICTTIDCKKSQLTKQ